MQKTETQMLAHKRAVDAQRKALALNKKRAKHALAVQAMARMAGAR